MTVHHHLDPNSGAAGIMWQLSRCYRALGHSVTELSFDDLPAPVPARLGPLAFPSLVAARIGLNRNGRSLDVIDATTGDAWLWATIPHWRGSVDRPLLVTRSHGLEHTAHEEFLRDVQAGTERRTWKYPLYWGGLRLWEVATSLRRSDIVLFSNSPDLEYAVSRLGVSRARAHVVPNGVPPAFLERPFEDFPTNTDGPIRIAQVASYIPRKGVKYGIEALNGLLRRHPAVEVSFLGTGHDEQTVLRDVDPEIRARVTVRPRFERDELPELLKGHQIKLLPTTFEGFSVALIEAMACGLAPVTTATAGSLEVVRDGANGLLVPARDSQALEAALERLIEDPVLLQRLRRGAHETARSYSWSRIAERTLALYRQAAEAKLGHETESSRRA